MPKLSFFDVLTDRDYDVKLLENPVIFRTHGQRILTVQGFSDKWFVLTGSGEVYFAKLCDLKLLAEDHFAVLKQLFLSWITFVGL